MTSQMAAFWMVRKSMIFKKFAQQPKAEKMAPIGLNNLKIVWLNFKLRTLE